MSGVLPRLNLTTASPNTPAPSSSNTSTPTKSIPPVDKAPGAQQTAAQRKVTPRPITPGSVQSKNIASASHFTQPKLSSATKSQLATNPATAKTGDPIQAASTNSGWGSPAWAPLSFTDTSPLSPVGFNISFPPDPTSALHQKPDASFKFSPPTQATRSEAS